MHTYNYEGFDIHIDTQPFELFMSLQNMAKEEGWIKAITGSGDTHFGVITVDGVPYYSLTYQRLSKEVMRVGTKLYSNPSIRKSLTPTIIRDMYREAVSIFDNDKDIKLKFITRPINTPSHDTFLKRFGFESDDNYYLIGGNKYEITSWKYLYYKGDLSALDPQVLSKEKFEMMFGKYYFNYNWSTPAITNAKAILNNPTSCLEIGAFEGRFAIWLAENYNCTVDTIDPYNGSLYGVAQELYDEARKNCESNLSKCEKEITLHKEQSFDVMVKLYSENKSYDFIYIDGSHHSKEVLSDLVLAWRLLKEGGAILLDDASLWKARSHVTGIVDQDVTSSPRLAVDSFIHIHWKDIEVLHLPDSSQVAFIKHQPRQ
jgi:predicted O-methyltransferase YrrM